jgi:DNA-binding PucR family transcriptional regulator
VDAAPPHAAPPPPIAPPQDRSAQGSPARDATPRAPAGWEGVAAVAARVAGQLDELAARIVADIEREIDGYGTGLVPRDDLARSVASNLRVTLRGVAERRGPTPEEITGRRPLGGRRAMQGIGVDALIQAYHIGFRELWAALVAAVPPDDPATATQLLAAATTVWQWTHEATAAIAAEHAEALHATEARALSARQRFLELLLLGDPARPEAEVLGRSLGFDPGAWFQATVLRSETGELDAVLLQRRLEASPGHHAVVVRGASAVVLSQEADATVVADAARQVAPTATIACGAVRPGLAGACTSLEDAERTLPVTPGAATARFDDVWLWATLGGASERLEPLLATGRRVAAEHPHLAEAVEAFASARFSVSEAARRLGLHANTVAYRLDRWAELTGWDPRSFPGLSHSLAALHVPS